MSRCREGEGEQSEMRRCMLCMRKWLLKRNASPVFRYSSLSDCLAAQETAGEGVIKSMMLMARCMI